MPACLQVLGLSKYCQSSNLPNIIARYTTGTTTRTPTRLPHLLRNRDHHAFLLPPHMLDVRKTPYVGHNGGCGPGWQKRLSSTSSPDHLAPSVIRPSEIISTPRSQMSTHLKASQSLMPHGRRLFIFQSPHHHVDLGYGDGSTK